MRPLLRAPRSPQDRVNELVQRRVRSWLKLNENNSLVELLKDKSTDIMLTLCRNEKFRAAVEADDQKQVNKILNRTFSNRRNRAYQKSMSAQYKNHASFEAAIDDHVDLSFFVRGGGVNDNQELTGVPKDPYVAIEWVLDDMLVRSTSNLRPDLTEELLTLDAEGRQVVILYWCFPKHNAQVKADILEVSPEALTSAAHRHAKLIKRKLGVSLDV